MAHAYQEYDFERRQAVMLLLAKPDPPDLAPRRHHLTQQGAEWRFQHLQWLPLVNMQYRRGDGEV